MNQPSSAMTLYQGSRIDPVSERVPRDAAHSIRPAPSSPARAACVYGDGTPFPHDGDFIEMTRHAIDCGVALLAASEAITRARQRIDDVERQRKLERRRLEAIEAGIVRTVRSDVEVSGDHGARSRERIVDAASAAIAVEIAEIDAAASAELARARAIASGASDLARAAIEAFLLKHVLPGTRTALRLTASDLAYAGDVTFATPFDVEASFDLQIPDASAWHAPRRVVEIAPGIELSLQVESGVFSKRSSIEKVRLDKLFLSGFDLGEERATLTLRRKPHAGAGYTLDYDFSAESPRVRARRIDAEGNNAADPPIELSGDDKARALDLWQNLVEATRELAMYRRAMVIAEIDDDPKVICERLVSVLAPTVNEIARRSGTPSELVLRQDVCAGRRDEIYITKTELSDKVSALPIALRSVFAPLDLVMPHRLRLPSAPAPEVIDRAWEDAAETPGPVSHAREITEPSPE